MQFERHRTWFMCAIVMVWKGDRANICCLRSKYQCWIIYIYIHRKLFYTITYTRNLFDTNQLIIKYSSGTSTADISHLCHDQSKKWLYTTQFARKVFVFILIFSRLHQTQSQTIYANNINVWQSLPLSVCRLCFKEKYIYIWLTSLPNGSLTYSDTIGYDSKLLVVPTFVLLWCNECKQWFEMWNGFFVAKRILTQSQWNCLFFKFQYKFQQIIRNLFVIMQYESIQFLSCSICRYNFCQSDFKSRLKHKLSNSFEYNS